MESAINNYNLEFSLPIIIEAKSKIKILEWALINNKFGDCHYQI